MRAGTMLQSPYEDKFEWQVDNYNGVYKMFYAKN